MNDAVVSLGIKGCVRTIVVCMETTDSQGISFVPHVSCVRTIVVWKLRRKSGSYASRYALRKNHSGMETIRTYSEAEKIDIRCVRTIVVWKLWNGMRLITVKFSLRKNHSGMETGLTGCYQQGLQRLRKNHSGMETRLRRAIEMLRRIVA